MTLRAVLLGLLGAAFVCGATYFNDAVMHQTYLVGNNMPIFVYGFLILFVLLLNPLLRRVAPRLSFTGTEIAVALALTLAACCIPGSGLMRTFTSSLVLPYHIERTQPAWQQREVLKRAPPHMLAAVTAENEDDVVNGFVQGKSIARQHIRLSQVPWRAWVGTLAFWLPLVVIFWGALLGLALVVHRQWADHEQLPYPIATFANALLPGEGSVVSDVLRSRLFWVGLLAVFLIHMNNYLCRWYPNASIPIPLTLDFQALNPLFPTLIRGNGGITLHPTLYFTVIAFAYFLATDVSLALGIGPTLWFLVVGTLSAYGISVGGTSPNITQSLAFGAYVGMFCVLLYTGRRYYSQVLAASVGFRGGGEADRSSVWGARVFMGGMLAFVLYITFLARLDWQLAVIFAAVAVLIFLGMSRIIAETGVFFIQAYFYPLSVMTAVLGAQAVGPQAILIVCLLTVVLLIDPREAFMPFMVNSLKLLDERRVGVGRFAKRAGVAVLVGLAVAVPVTLYLQYDRGANMGDGWACGYVPYMPFAELVQAEQRLESQGALEAARDVSGWGHFTSLRPERTCVMAMGAGLGLVLLFTLGRLRFTKWPLHPVLFLVWVSYPGAWFAGSFFVGWLVKGLVTKFGGNSVYRSLKPLMFGLIAGEMAGGLAAILIGAAYYFVTGKPPVNFSILPS